MHYPPSLGSQKCVSFFQHAALHCVILLILLINTLHTPSTEFEIDLRRPRVWDTRVRDVENELNDHIAHLTMCPAIVVFRDEYD